MNNVWIKIAKTLDRRFYNVYDEFWKDEGVHEYNNPWGKKRRNKNAENDIWAKTRGNNLILEIYSSRILDYLAVYYLPAMTALNENELFLLLVITNLLSISVTPMTRRNINGIDCMKEKMNFTVLLEKMMQSETRREYSDVLARKSGFRVIEEQSQDDADMDTEEGPIIIGGTAEYSEEECYRDYCALIKRMLASEDDEAFLEQYKCYHKIREKIDQGWYPRWYSEGTDDIKLDLDNSFVTDSSVCKHFRLSCMLGHPEEEETIVLKWQDVLKYPSIYEVLVEKRAAELKSDADADIYYLSRKMDMLNAIWISEYRILQEQRIRAEQKLGEYHHKDLRDAWKEKRKNLSSYMNLSPVQGRYDKYLEGEARIAINSCMAALDKLLAEYRHIKDAGELSRAGEAVENYLKSRYADLIETTDSGEDEDSCSELYMELWSQDNFYRQIGISDNESYLQRYCFSDYLLNAYEDGSEEVSVDYNMRRIFEEQLLVDVDKIMKFWLNHNLSLTKKIICEL